MSRPMKNSGIAWIGQVPEHWTVAPVRSVLKEVTAKNIFGKETTALQFRYGTIVEKDNFDATEDEYVARTIRNYTLIYPGVLVLNGLNLNYDFVTKRVALSRLKGAITSAYMTITPIDTHVLMPEFVEYLFKSYDAKMAFHGMGEGVRKILNFNELKRQPIIYPTYIEQKRIVQVLDKKCAEIDTLSNSIQQQIDTLEQYKRAVITETVTKGLNPSAPMKDSGIPWIGQIPAHWNLNKLKYVTTKLERGTSPDYTDEELTRVVNQATFSRGFFNAKDTKFSTKPAAGSRGLLKRHDVLLASTGGGVLGKTHFFDEVETYVADGHVTIARANEKKILSKLLYYLFFTNFDTFNALMTKGSTNQTELQSLDLANMFIPVPPLSEQQQIVQVLDRHTQTIARAIHSKQQQLEKLEQYKKAIIFEYVTGKKQVPEA